MNKNYELKKKIKTTWGLIYAEAGLNQSQTQTLICFIRVIT